MSTNTDTGHHSPGRDIDGALAPHIQLEEKSKRKLEEYPADIVDQLKSAAFSEAKAANTYVKHVNPTNGSDNSKVVTVELTDDGLVIETKDIVGVVNLTPNATLQIDPKIGWSEILEMFLAVGEDRRSLEYRGIPIREFLADDIGIEDIFIVVALNYLDSLDDIFRHGFIRSFDRQRTQGLDGRGQIDIEQSLKNFDLPNGVPKHEFVEKTVEYSIPLNDVIYRAGKELERLFHYYAASTSASESYARIFSRLERAVDKLEHRGINGDSISLADVSRVTTNDIPRQRNYYSDALHISKTILSSTIGQPLDEGREELLMEYIIGMESLFEEFVGLSIEQELNQLRDQPFLTGLEDVSVEKQSYRLFEDEDVTLSCQPDHVITDENAAIAVLDSKYYAEDNDPLKGWSRSRLLSYGFRLEIDQLGMIAPLATQAAHKFKGRSGSLHIIAPEEEIFTTEGLRSAIRMFFRNTIAEEENIPARKDIETRQICHPDIEANTLQEALESESLKTDSIVNDSLSILKYIKEQRLSNEVNPRGTQYMGPLHKFQSYLTNNADNCDVVVPVFVDSTEPQAALIQEYEDTDKDTPEFKDTDEFIKLHCFQTDNKGNMTDYYSPKPFVISW